VAQRPLRGRTKARRHADRGARRRRPDPATSSSASGLNVNSPGAALPAELTRQATTLAAITGRPLDLNRLTAAIIGAACSPPYEEFVDGGYRERFCRPLEPALTSARQGGDPRAGRPRVSGVAGGVDDEGSLLIRGEGGRPQRFHAGEVTVGG